MHRLRKCSHAVVQAFDQILGRVAKISIRTLMLEKPPTYAEEGRDHVVEGGLTHRCQDQVVTFARPMGMSEAIFERSDSAGASIVCHDAALTAIVSGVAIAMIPSGDMPLKR